MKFSEFFLGTDKEKEAARLVKELKAEANLNRRKLKRLIEAKTISRRRFIRLLGLGLLAGASIAPILPNVVSSQSNKKVDASEADTDQVTPEDETKTAEQQTEILIRKIEDGFKKYADDMRVLTATVSSQQLRAMLNSPFELLDGNRGNLHKNNETNARVGLTEMPLGHYAYGILEKYFKQLDLPLAAYAPQGRNLLISRQYEPAHNIDNSIIYHELVHAVDDIKQREKFRDGKISGYDVITKGQGVTLSSEIKAYALQVEMLNLQLGGELKGSAVKGIRLGTDEQLRKVASELGLKPTQSELGRLQMLYHLLLLADELYPQGIQDGQVTARFTSRLFEENEHRELYAVSQGGKLERLTRDMFNKYQLDFAKLD